MRIVSNERDVSKESSRIDVPPALPICTRGEDGTLIHDLSDAGAAFI
jgi:hypothetical protein